MAASKKGSESISKLWLRQCLSRQRWNYPQGSSVAPIKTSLLFTSVSSELGLFGRWITKFLERQSTILWDTVDIGIAVRHRSEQEAPKAWMAPSLWCGRQRGRGELGVVILQGSLSPQAGPKMQHLQGQYMFMVFKCSATSAVPLLKLINGVFQIIFLCPKEATASGAFRLG